MRRSSHERFMVRGGMGVIEPEWRINMGLAKKTFVYSILLAVLMVSMVAGYFSFMLPSLYVNYMMDNNLDSIIAIQEGYQNTRSYENLSVKNPSGTFSVEIPDTGNCIYATGKFFHVSLKIKDAELIELLNTFRQYENNAQTQAEISETFDDEFLQQVQETLKNKLFQGKILPADYPLEIQSERRDTDKVFAEEFNNAQGKVHIISEQLMVYESSVSDGANTYITYMAVGKTEDSLIISFLPVMAPEMKDIRSVVSKSLPMIAAVVFLAVLICSQIFSGKIVNPVVRLAGYAESVREADNFVIDPFKVDSHDEIGALGKTLNELYASLQEKNRFLEEENERQEVFLRASSHQLKTPITAALLLVDGMMNQVGKYKNAKEYLPKVKEQLLSMKKIVEDILHLNHCADNLHSESVSIKEIVEQVINNYRFHIIDKDLQIAIEGGGILYTEREIIKKMIDNLLSNAVQYTPVGNLIRITLSDNHFCIRNYGAAIEKELLPNIYEPFVSSDTRQKGKGLGLYVVSYYSRLLGGSVRIENFEGGVQAELDFR